MLSVDELAQMIDHSILLPGHTDAASWKTFEPRWYPLVVSSCTRYPRLVSLRSR